MATSGLDMKGSKIPGELGCVNTDGKDCVDTEGGLTDEDLQDLHEDILDRNEDGVRSLLTEFLEQGKCKSPTGDGWVYGKVGG